jgi:catechol 2,3-dioxygenase-like lactoylglutathione lyase family enzyme
MLASNTVIGFIPVADLARAESFFHGKLGLPVLTPNDGFALVLGAAGGATIRCVLTPGGTHPQPFTIFGWEVSDIRASVRLLREAGILLIVYPHLPQDDDAIWTAPGGSRIAWFHDPDGNVLSLSEQR